MNIVCLFKGHDWHYARGNSRGAITGKIRHRCVRRVCKRCNRAQEISYFTSRIKINGAAYFGKPRWIPTINQESE